MRDPECLMATWQPTVYQTNAWKPSQCRESVLKLTTIPDRLCGTMFIYRVSSDGDEIVFGSVG